MVNKYTKKEMISKKELRKLYIEKKMTYKEIAEFKGFSVKIIQNRMKEYGITPRIAAKRNQKGELNHMWKGGRITKKDGYIYVKTSKHPRSDRGYVAEHILVVEAKLGRQLRYISKGHKDNEVVHHKDENKHNNESSNLEVMTNSQHIALHSKLRRGGDADVN